MLISSFSLIIDRCQEGSQAELKGRWGTRTSSGLSCLKKIRHRRLVLIIGECSDRINVFSIGSKYASVMCTFLYLF